MKDCWIRGAAIALFVTAMSGCQSAALTSAKIYIQQEDWARAAQQLDAATTQNPADAEAWELLGVAQAHLERFADAGRSFDRAVAADPERAKTTESWRSRFRAEAINRGVDALKTEDFAAAAVAFEAAAGVDPRSADAQRSLGYVYYQLERTEDAVAAYRRALDLDPGHQDTMVRLGYLFYNEQRYAEALEWLAPAAAGSQDGQLLTVVANAYLELGRDDEALAALETAHAAQPTNADVLMEIGRIHWDREDFAGAGQAYAQAVEVAPDNPDAHHNLAMALLEQERGDEARAELERVVELDPELADAWYWLGVLYARANRAADSERAFARAAELGVE